MINQQQQKMVSHCAALFDLPPEKKTHGTAVVDLYALLVKMDQTVQHNCRLFFGLLLLLLWSVLGLYLFSYLHRSSWHQLADILHRPQFNELIWRPSPTVKGHRIIKQGKPLNCRIHYKFYYDIDRDRVPF